MATIKGRPALKFDVSLALQNIDQEIARTKAEYESRIHQLQEGRAVLEKQGDHILAAFDLLRTYGRPASAEENATPDQPLVGVRIVPANTHRMALRENILNIVNAAPYPLRVDDVLVPLEAAKYKTTKGAVMQQLALAFKRGDLKRMGPGLYWKKNASANGAKKASAINGDTDTLETRIAALVKNSPVPLTGVQVVEQLKDQGYKFVHAKRPAMTVAAILKNDLHAKVHHVKGQNAKGYTL